MTCGKLSFRTNLNLPSEKKNQENEGERQTKPENVQQNERTGQIRQQTEIIYSGLKGQMVVCCLSSTGNTDLHETSEIYK